MADGVHAASKAIEATGADAVAYGLAGQSRRQELTTRHDTVLALGEPGDQDIRTLA